MKKAQSILEYVIVFTVIVAAIAVAATQLIKPAVNQTFEDSAAAMTAASARMRGGVTSETTETSEGTTTVAENNATSSSDVTGTTTTASAAKVYIPTNVYLTSAQQQQLTDAGIEIWSSSNYSEKIVGTGLTSKQQAVVGGLNTSNN